MSARVPKYGRPRLTSWALSPAGLLAPRSLAALLAGGLVPSGMVMPGFGSDLSSSNRSAWSYKDFPLPFLPVDVSRLQDEESSTTLRPFLDTLEDQEAVERAAIPVERTEGPVLLFSSGDDQVWPSARLAEISMERLSRYEHPYQYEHVCYREARHHISLPYLPTTSQRTCRSAEEHEPIGGTPEADAAASADSWTRTLVFLAKL